MVDANYSEIESDILKYEERRVILTRWYVHGHERKALVTNYANDVDLVNVMETVARKLYASTQEPTEIASVRTGQVTLPTQIGKDLINLCRRFDPSLPARHGQKAFNPWVKVMLVALCRWGETGGSGQTFPGVGIPPEERDALDQIAHFVREETRSKAFDQQQKNEKRVATQNLRSACMYIVRLFQSHSLLLILRVDLYYRGDGKEWARTDEAQSTFDRFKRKLHASQIVPDVLGQLVRREEGPELGIHYHVLVALDGHKRGDARGYAESIGRSWVDEYAGRERGAYFNCYARRRECTLNGLGKVHVSDCRSLIGLHVALRYITKPYYQVKIKSDHEKNFRRGLMKKPTDKKCGAPLKPGHDLSFVHQIFGAGWNFKPSNVMIGNSVLRSPAPASP